MKYRQRTDPKVIRELTDEEAAALVPGIYEPVEDEEADKDDGLSRRHKPRR